MTEKVPEDLALVGGRIQILEPAGLLLTVSDHDSGSLFPRTVMYAWARKSR